MFYVLQVKIFKYNRAWMDKQMSEFIVFMSFDWKKSDCFHCQMFFFCSVGFGGG